MTNYQTPSDPRNLPFNLAFGPDLFFEWVPKHPEVLQSFQQWMTCQREGHTHWLDFYPFEQQVVQGFDDQDPDAVLLVDVGGGMGQEIREIKARFPELPGRMILQDLSSTIERVQAEGAGSMEAMAHDFFTPQPIQGKISKPPSPRTG
jgi:demethylsterigmatocystin 6-O-methyltransferase